MTSSLDRTLFSLLFLLSLSLACRQKESKVGGIPVFSAATFKQEVIEYKDSVNKVLSTLSLDKKDIVGASAEGGEASVYGKGKDTLKVALVYYGEGGKVEYELYYRKGKVVLFNEVTSRYKVPINMEPAKIEDESHRTFVIHEGAVLDEKDGQEVLSLIRELEKDIRQQ
jgi:hypothetical protein